MPVYICQAGANSSEPWRHGLQVYAAPFALTDAQLPEKEETDGTTSAPHLVPTSTEVAAQIEAEAEYVNGPPRPWPEGHGNARLAQQTNAGSVPLTAQNANANANADANHNQTQGGSDPIQQHMASLQLGLPVRRIRHAEVVLVDDVCIAYDRHWLRLRWSGVKGGFAGYVALGKVNETVFSQHVMDALQLRETANPSDSGNEAEGMDDVSERPADLDGGLVLRQSQTRDLSPSVDVEDEDEDDREEKDEENEDGNRDDADELQDNASALSSEPYESISAVCFRTGIEFPSSGYMKLMAMYEDGLSPAVSSAPLPTEPIFCRICREGLHDDADDEQPSPTMENQIDEADARCIPCPPSEPLLNEADGSDNIPRAKTQGPVQPHPVYHPNSHAAENPLISPCECSGSMAFVHYLCVEQWRCRSRHPNARRGLNCETCGKPYALPPPSVRPVDNEDWLQAMPPHVLEALRQPHTLWQIGAWIVRRRWLRPIAPVLMSPIVALYCRARRLLKKKGVARRRWACSLCRRRARWKCVRCLRSYYCSRQCQNVSWHIVHKHVCYKPSRWYWSVIVYGMATLLTFPGILRDPLVYDLGFSFLPLSFYVMAILGGGIATVLKKSVGLDLRGRTFEVVVILLTLGLAYLSLGLLRAFFGDSSKCYGALGSQKLSEHDQFFQFLRRMQKSILEPAKNWFLIWDRAALSSGTWPKKILCMPKQESGCFEHLPKANSDFLFDEEFGGKCSMDMILVSSLLQGAALVAAGNHYWKRRDRQRRAARRPRVHQD
mmetsp:Transcript_23389/g.51212  ORF Transcript_23389/g.51212 Transcript_23389/m.51212 type:complete len:779 (+) Transcript_23389:332-2668(+)